MLCRTCLAHYSCCWSLSPLQQIRASRKEKPQVHHCTHTEGFLPLLYTPAALVPPYSLKQTLPTAQGRNSVGFVCVCAKGSVCMKAHNKKMLDVLISS